MQSPTPMLSSRSQVVISAALFVLAAVTLSPFFDVLVPALPFATGEVRWRFQIFGAFLAALPQLAFLLAVIIAVGVLTGHRRAVRAAGIIALLLALAAAPLLPIFGLDFLEMRRMVALDRKATFDLAALKTGAFGGIFVLLLAYLGWKSFSASASDRNATRKAEGGGLVVGQD